ncbi:hypothetical protein MASR2M18_16290 [Ignavibacteria bacterium]|nr:phosphatidylglycerophosphatase A [Bacteroidota bacterium]
MIITLPTIVSSSRILLAPLVYVLIVAESAGAWHWAAIIFFVGALTDYADGWLARKRGEVTSFGVFFDPLADKILVSAAFFGFAEADILPLWLVVTVIVRDVITTLLRSYADAVGQPVVTSRAAKAKTFLQMSFVVWLLALAWLGTANFTFSAHALSLLKSDITLYAMAAVTIYTVWTGAEYLWVNRETTRSFFVKDMREYTSEWLATGFGIGYWPFMPGTFGSLAALSTAIVIHNHSFFLFLACAAILIGLWAIPPAERKYGKDDSRIILDECVGMWIVLSWPFVPISIFWSLLGFALFRIFDILKPFPISWANSKNGVIWVLTDDVLAAVAAVIFLHLIYTAAMFFPFVAMFVKN